MNLLSEIHFLTVRDDISIKHNDFGVFKYYGKKESTDNILSNSKKLYCEQRGGTWFPNNKRPHRVKDKLKELEDNLFQDKIICHSWNDCDLYFLLARGLLVHITLNPSTNDILNIQIIKSLALKLGTELICDGVISGEQIVCICSDGRVLCSGGVWKDGWVIDCIGKKRVTLCDQLLCVWGCVSAEHPQPWSPLTKNHHRANLILYWMGLKGPELLAHKKTEGEPIEVIISKICHRNLIVVEQKVSLRGAVSVEVSTLEATSNSLKRLSVTSVPLQTQISCCTLSDNENQLLLGCIDGSIAILDRQRGSTRIIKSSIIPTFAIWHKDGAVAAVTNDKGQLQYFDLALNRINVQLSGEDCTPIGLLDLSAYFHMQPNVSLIVWGPKDVLVVFEHGPLALITHQAGMLMFGSLVQQYLGAGKIKRSIALLLSWEWNDQCFCALQRIVAYLLKLPLTNETAQNLQNTLSRFHNPSVPLSPDIHHKYGSQVRALTRRFFHQLVRYKMFETAFLLAVDIGHHDLFMDLYHCATKIGEKEMAAAARAQASALLSRCSSAVSCCSRSSCSQCSDSCSSSSSNSSSSSVGNKPNRPVFSLPEFSQTFNDNCLTTNFNNINPKTYANENFSNYSTPVLPSIDLPKASIISKPIFNSRLLNFSQALPTSVHLNTPPLPVTPAFPHTIPLSVRNFSLPPTTLNPNNFKTIPENSSYCPLTPPTPKVLPDTSFHQVTSTPPPPLPVPTQNMNLFATSSPPRAQNQLNNNNVNGGRKQQAKVKFSDTVTAFIVPEVKRPIRPPPPPHITDPQKELADSLPLCHPNEDYLKDFTPVRRIESDEAPTQSKIKVVHFGVV